ncbi:hypothetical protein B5F40_01285 [Gordonibacter sp. An230]|nr:hypothetical protein B5F40_01285 [Gordonibacter sp. An230]
MLAASALARGVTRRREEGDVYECAQRVEAGVREGHSRNGRVVRLEGNPESPISRGGLCAKGLSGI